MHLILGVPTHKIQCPFLQRPGLNYVPRDIQSRVISILVALGCLRQRLASRTFAARVKKGIIFVLCGVKIKYP